MKIEFQSTSSKPTQEVNFSRKVNDSHPPFTFNSNIVYQDMSQKHLLTLFIILYLFTSFIISKKSKTSI